MPVVVAAVVLLGSAGALLWAADAAAPARSATSAPAGPAVTEARRLVDAAKYKEALELIAKELSATRRLQGGGDMQELLFLRGETLLRMGNNVPAADAFDKAARAAAGATPPDVRAAALARANALLARKSPKAQYRPPGGGEPINVADPAARKAAFAAMHDELSKSLAAKIADARRQSTLGPMHDLLPSVAQLGALEFAETGAAPQAKEILTDFGGHAARLMVDELRRIGYRVDQLDELADAAAAYVYGGGVVARRGLHTDERKELDESIAYVRRIEQTARKIRADVRLLGFPGDRWEPIIADAGDLAHRAEAIRELGK
jgi:hypothetical protein